MKAPRPIVWIGSLAALLAGLTTTFTFWGDYGWKIRKDYDAEHVEEATSNVILERLDALQVQQMEIQNLTEESHQHWECDEMFEEIPELKFAAQQEQDPAEKVRKEHLVQVTEQAFQDMNCLRFFKQ